jgi:aminomethyltransferase
MKRTPLYPVHVENGARMVEFAGYMMPMQFRGILHEHLQVRRKVGIFDVSHMGEVEVLGEDALEFVNLVTSNDASKLQVGGVQYSLLLLPSGGIIDETLVYRLQDRYMLVVNAVNTEKDYRWLLEQKRGKVELRNRSGELAILAVQGPLSEMVMENTCGFQLSSLRYYNFIDTEIAGQSCLLSRTGYTGDDGFETFMEWDSAPRIWSTIMECGRGWGIEPVGLGARDTLRLEMRYCLHGSDVDEKTTPLEAGLGWIVGWNKTDFIGRDILLRQKDKGVTRRLVGFELEKGIPRPQCEIYFRGEKVGLVTSGTYSPSLRKGIGMGYVSVPLHKYDTELEIKMRDRFERAKVVKTPFYKSASHK